MCVRGARRCCFLLGFEPERGSFVCTSFFEFVVLFSGGFVCVRASTRCKRSGVSPAIGDDVGVENSGLRVLVPISNPAKVNILQLLLIFLVVLVSLFCGFVIICVGF